jgi:methyltransferase
MTAVVLLVVIFTTLLLEWRRALSNTNAQRRRGGIEARDDVYAWMAVVYPGGFLAMLAEGWLRGVSMASPWFLAGAAVFGFSKALKWWAIAALGPFWTFRVIVVPGARLVAGGPYRWLRHPNYVGVIGELAGVALMTTARVSGPLVVAAFAIILWRRVRVENAALEQLGADAILRRG